MAGYFGFAFTVVALPSSLVGQAIASVFYPRIASLHRSGHPTAEPVTRLATLLLLVAVPVFAATLLMGTELFTVLFGDTWRTAGVIAAIISPWLAMNFLSSPLSALATVHDKLGRLLALSVLEASLRLGTLALGRLTHSTMIGVGAYAASGFMISSYYVIWVLNLAGANTRDWLGPIHRYLLGATAAVVTLVSARGAIDRSIYIALSLVVLAALSVGAASHARIVIRPKGQS